VAYWFAGFFATDFPRPAALPEGVVWRDIASPFVGVGVRLSARCDAAPRPPLADVPALARSLGLDAAARWVYLDYVCWGGAINSVSGLGSRDGVPFGPVAESARDKVEDAYTGLMERFGVSKPDALRFEPFTRGYWGEH